MSDKYVACHFQFATRAKKIKNNPILNEVLSDEALLRRYRREVQNLQKKLEEVRSSFFMSNPLQRLPKLYFLCSNH